MNIITGYISSTSGTVTIDGKEILENPKEAKAKIGYLPEIPPLYTDMTVKKYLEFMFDLKKVKLPKKEHIEEVMRLVRITEQADRIIKNLSKGYRQRVGFAQALLGNPPVLILDEPTVGLDPMQIIEIRKLIKSLGKKHTIILSSHVLSEISATCDRILVISNGKIVADAKTDELSSSTAGEEKLALVVEGAASDIISAIKNIPAVIRVNKISEKNGNSAKYMVEYEKITTYAVMYLTQWQESAVRFLICSRATKHLRKCSLSLLLTAIMTQSEVKNNGGNFKARAFFLF